MHRPAPVKKLSLPKTNGGNRGKISVVDMVSLGFIGFLYLFHLRPEKVLQLIFFRWWQCAFLSALLGGCGSPGFYLGISKHMVC